MKRPTMIGMVSLVLLGVVGSLAAKKPTTQPNESRLAGKFLVISHQGMYHGVSKNARFESVGPYFPHLLK